ncbi:LrgB-domain-containing protein [Gonapodya prolifera JEL478]|uniref:LrgB-domain-containing protein n=1 Tax=Gonapodya prolifera (strain JEL478) TaxID=1344416 RepID=A0A139AZK7_GONPJ|nr:LrgB-domain-containing protein [Gonapodya prolifera JEL478]|eukprot:KXS21915.1 LrgB-domain-containing protein [Gonapodya prolifera JEL478]
MDLLSSLRGRTQRHLTKYRRRLIDNWLRTPPVIVSFWVMMWGIDRALAELSLSFPPSVIALVLIFMILVVVEQLLPKGVITWILYVFHPGCCFLLKWMAVLFSPALVTIPLMEFIGIAEVFRLTAVFVVGLFLFVPGTAYLALGAKRIVALTQNLTRTRSSNAATIARQPVLAEGETVEGSTAHAVPERPNEPLLVLPTPVWPPLQEAGQERVLESEDEDDPISFATDGDEAVLRRIEAGARRPSRVSQFFSAFPASRPPPSFDFDHPVSEVPDTRLVANQNPPIVLSTSKGGESKVPELDLSTRAPPNTQPKSNTERREHSITRRPSVKKGSSRPLSVHVVTYAVLFVISSAIYGTTGVITPLLLSWNILSYFAGMFLPDRAKRFLHPLLTSVALTWALIAVIGAIRGSGFSEALKLYSNGVKYLQVLTPSANSPRSLPGAGDILLSVLDASVVALAFKMFEHRELLVKYGFEVTFTVATVCFCSTWLHVLFARILGMQPALGLAMIPRFVTTPLAIQSANSLGAPTSLTATVVVLTGIVGAIIGPTLLKFSRINMTDPLVVGLATGATSHGIGTSSLLVSFPDAAAVSSLSFLLAGVFTVALTKVPPLQMALKSAAGA